MTTDEHEAGCQCGAHGPLPGSQSLGELDFQKSACAAAQKGDVAKLARLLDSLPALLHDDGVTGDAGCQECEAL